MGWLLQMALSLLVCLLYASPVKAQSETENNDDGQSFLWLPYKDGIEFLKHFLYYLRESGIFGEKNAPVYADIEDCLTETLQNGTRRAAKNEAMFGYYPKKDLEEYMNVETARSMYHACDEHILLSQFNKIAEALKRASIDVTGKEHDSVKEILNYLDDDVEDDSRDDVGGSLVDMGAADSLVSAEKAGIFTTAQSVTENNDDGQSFLWSPYKDAVEFLKHVFHYLSESEIFGEKKASGMIADMKDGITEILQDKTKSGEFSKKLLEESMNLEMAAFMIDACDGDISPSHRNIIADALKRASIDVMGKEHKSVKVIVKYFDYYRQNRADDCTEDDRGCGGSAGGQPFLWLPYKRALKFLKLAYRYLIKSGIFDDEQVSGLTADGKSGIANILMDKIRSGKFSKKHLEGTMNIDMAAEMVDSCDGKVTLEQRNAIADALKQASMDTMGKEHDSVKEILNYVDYYRESSLGALTDDAGGTLLNKGAGAVESLGSAEGAGTDMCDPETWMSMLLDTIDGKKTRVVYMTSMSLAVTKEKVCLNGGVTWIE